jgi:signal recognition particle receptor subunit beta
MAEGANGVVFFLLGSIVRTTDMTEEFLQNIFQAFAQHSDYHFIVKIEKADNVNARENAS